MELRSKASVLFHMLVYMSYVYIHLPSVVDSQMCIKQNKAHLSFEITFL